MIDGYLTINNIVKKWGLTPRRVRAMCLNGQTSGAARLGRKSAIPVNASRPLDGRITTGEFKNWRSK